MTIDALCKKLELAAMITVATEWKDDIHVDTRRVIIIWFIGWATQGTLCGHVKNNLIITRKDFYHVRSQYLK